MHLEDDYRAEIGMIHYSGHPSGPNGLRIVQPDVIDTGSHGTIWRYAHIARWIHERTTLQPDRYLHSLAELQPVSLPIGVRYSINCILFRKQLWSELPEGEDDEELLRGYCMDYSLTSLCCRRVPFVHLAYFPQQEGVHDVVQATRNFYQKRLKLPFHISSFESKEQDLEARLRWHEQLMIRLIQKNHNS
jgi:hypothetical protein